MEGRVWIGLVVAPWLSLAGGCLPLLTPPATASVSAGPAAGNVPSEHGVPVVTQLRAALHPLGAAKEMQDRKYDVGAGAVADLTGGDLLAAGPYVDVSYQLVPAPRGRAGFRAYVSGRGAWVWTADGDHGPGGGVAVGGELVGFVEMAGAEADADGIAALAALGELGLGIELGVDARSAGPRRYLVLHAGARLRIPLTAGFLFVPGVLRGLH